MSRDKRVLEVADALAISYAHALRYVKEIGNDYDHRVELIHACREKLEAEKAENFPKPKRKRGVLPKGAGRVNCGECDATAAADGMGSPIVLKHDDGCHEKYPVKDHRYDAGLPRDDSNGCIYNLNYDWDPDGPELCGRPLSEHYRSEYEEDGR